MRIGFITIGQTPRDDITPAFREMLGSEHTMIERGGLDGMSESEIAQRGPQQAEEFFITRLRDRRVARVSRAWMRDRVQTLIDDLDAEGIDLIVVLCSGPFPGLEARSPILIPDVVMRQLVLGIMPAGRLGVVSPMEEQIPMLRDKWYPYPDTSLVAASPYSDATQVAQAAASLRHCDLIVLDGMAYGLGAKQKVREASGRPVLIPQEVLSHCAAMLT